MAKSKTINEAMAREAVRTLIGWAGDDPDRPGLRDTPARVLDFYKEFFTGYNRSVADYAGSIANDTVFDDFVLVRDIPIVSFCEHHMLPATGRAAVAYIPGQTVAGIGALARIADDCARRLTTQEAMTADIISMIDKAFLPQGAAVAVSLDHGCMGLRRPRQAGSRVVTTKFSGAFLDNPDIQNRFLVLTTVAVADHDKR